MVKVIAAGFIAALLAAPALYGPCPVEKTEPGQYCTKCNKLLEKEGIKDGKCTVEGCGTKARKVDVCVRKYFACTNESPTAECTTMGEKAGKCKCGKELAEKTDKCLAMWGCMGCGMRTPFKEEFKHNDAAHAQMGAKKSMTRTCEKSGQPPHVGPDRK
jgi:hypothetical protein